MACSPSSSTSHTRISYRILPRCRFHTAFGSCTFNGSPPPDPPNRQHDGEQSPRHNAPSYRGDRDVAPPSLALWLSRNIRRRISKQSFSDDAGSLSTKKRQGCCCCCGRKCAVDGHLSVARGLEVHRSEQKEECPRSGESFSTHPSRVAPNNTSSAASRQVQYTDIYKESIVQ